MQQMVFIEEQQQQEQTEFSRKISVYIGISC